MAVVRNVEFTRGCDGNLKAISKLVDVHDRRPDLQYAACGNKHAVLWYILRRPAGPGCAQMLR
ncbi:MAG: TSCPD domain-containing protein [Clostridium sp.]